MASLSSFDVCTGHLPLVRSAGRIDGKRPIFGLWRGARTIFRGSGLSPR
jgi:hypothetical protein